MSEVIQAVRKNEPREIVITLGEGGVPAQRIIRGVSYLETPAGRTPDEPYVVDASEADLSAYMSGIAATADAQVRAANARAQGAIDVAKEYVDAANAREEAYVAEINLLKSVIQRFRDADAKWNADVQPALDHIDGVSN